MWLATAEAAPKFPAMVFANLQDRLRAALGVTPAPVVAVIRLAGVIGTVSPFRPGLTLSALAQPLERAFGLRNLKAVALALNSPGGSAAQSSLIHRRVRALAAEKNVPVLAFAEDVAASGGYWLACAADEIYVDDTSIIGSIGVITAGFGFPDLLRRIGVERRVYAIGPRKGMLDPFRPEQPDEVERLKALQSDLFGSFKELVMSRRGGRLKASPEELFTGEFWSGKRAVELGLADGIGDLRSVMRARFGDKVRLVPVGGARGWLRRRLRVAEAPDPAEWTTGFIAAVEERLWWDRYGL